MNRKYFNNLERARKVKEDSIIQDAVNIADSFVKELNNIKSLDSENIGPLDDCVETDDAEEMKITVFMGTVMSLYPSGKFYTPWANSNVEKCTACDGYGTVKNEWRDAELFEIAKKLRAIITTDAIEKYGAYCESKWPKELCALTDKIDTILRENDPVVTCPACDGATSEEAHFDELFTDTIEEILDKHDCWMESGEGDPCDLFACKRVDVLKCCECGGRFMSSDPRIVIRNNEDNICQTCLDSKTVMPIME